MFALLSVRSDQKKSHRTLRGRWPFFRLEGFTVYAGSLPPAAERPPAQIGVRFVVCAPRPVPHTASFATWQWLIWNRRLDDMRSISTFLRLHPIYTGSIRARLAVARDLFPRSSPL